MFNTDYPNGTPRKLMDVSRINQLGWSYTISFEEGVENVLRNLDSELERYK